MEPSTQFMQFAGQIVLVILFVSLAIYVYMALALMTIAKKTNTANPWMAWIPILNVYLMLKIADKPGWWLLLLLIPIVNIIITIIVWMVVAEKVNKPSWMGVLMIVPFVNFFIPGILAWADSSSMSSNNTASQQPQASQAEQGNDNLKKAKQKVIGAGTSIAALGWIWLIVSPGIYGYLIYKTGVHDVTAWFIWGGLWLLYLPVNIIFIILGNRIRKLLDRHISKYLIIILILSLLIMVISSFTSGKAGGILLLLVVIYTISATGHVNKLISNKDFLESVKNPNYKFTWGWFWLILVSFLLIGVSAFFLYNININY